MPIPHASAADKRKAFLALHASGCFVIPNPWNVGSARYLQGLGFKALATTSAGYAHSRGLPDGAPPLDEVLAHYRELADATSVPLYADFENGFALVLQNTDGLCEIRRRSFGWSADDTDLLELGLGARREARARQGTGRNGDTTPKGE
jgi:hypothetical protein